MISTGLYAFLKVQGLGFNPPALLTMIGGLMYSNFLPNAWQAGGVQGSGR